MSEEFAVRTATLSDYEGVCALLAVADELHRVNAPWLFQEPLVEPRSRDFFAGLLGSEDWAVLVAEAAGELVGVAAAVMRNAPELAIFVTQRWAVLDNIAVSTAWRRRGVGAALVRGAERWAQTRGAKWLELGVYEFNENARSFYQAMGYSPVWTKLRRPFGGDG